MSEASRPSDAVEDVHRYFHLGKVVSLMHPDVMNPDES